MQSNKYTVISIKRHNLFQRKLKKKRGRTRVNSNQMLGQIFHSCVVLPSYFCSHFIPQELATYCCMLRLAFSRRSTTGFYGYNIYEKKKKRKTNLRMTEPLHFVIYFFLKLDSSYNATPFSLLLNRTETHTHTHADRTQSRYVQKKHFSAPCWHQTTIGRLNQPVYRYHRQEQSMTNHNYGPSNEITGLLCLECI